MCHRERTRIVVVQIPNRREREVNIIPRRVDASSLSPSQVRMIHEEEITSLQASKINGAVES